jgi:hypothetical protein
MYIPQKHIYPFGKVEVGFWQAGHRQQFPPTSPPVTDADELFAHFFIQYRWNI